ncbi:cytochrome C [Endozoicomonas sp. G2_2]|uniref:c-type cytochrome n=1 Tax=Gammaproteobacteria TaxID=1236 RepID=UPI001ADCD912|nr:MULTISPECIES: cytochrome C [Gammaproteobacteria]MBO9469132.1 cytochrome C [Endozoicomonas sp. G2_2]
MTRTRQTITAVLFAVATASLAGAAFAADGDEPIVNDYSSMGAEYGSSDSDKADESKASVSNDSSASSSTSAAVEGDDEGNPYKVDCDGEGSCKVSEAVMIGYEKFGNHCAQCHAQNAEGSTFAPSLVQRLKGMGQGRFTAAVAGGVTRLDSTTGQYSVMPAWSENEDVMSHMQQLWAFLKARSDGALPAGRPQRMDNNG